nr:MAG TPA: Fragile site-associated protein C-terminus [Caudoviricetes sp.]DAO55923.1 MAG TPA: Fragile site-associated protein C-terminus [Caudoviricetes sp.]
MQPKVDTRCNSVWLHLQLVISKSTSPGWLREGAFA